MLLSAHLLKADEGMWIPMLLGELNEAEMQAMGMHLSADDIYSINHSSLKDAVLIFGGGCTAEIVSDQGLILTNYHCGYSNIQRHSSLEHDYLKDGFWAMSQKEELANPGLTVTRLVRMEDVTQDVLKNVTSQMTEMQRQKAIRKSSQELIDKAIEGTSYEASVKPFFYGNQYFLFVNEIFKDIRLVGAPPSNIGKFGGDTDNWVWPRHTGDFSVFRIYVNQDNQPAEFHNNNRPYHPLKHFNVSLKGAHENDFTFVFGYPGTTQEYLPASAIDLTVNVVNPIRIDLRTQRLKIMEKYMNQDPKVRIQYSSKQARVANGWKKWIGENLGIKKSNAIQHKKDAERLFQEWADNNQYKSLLPQLNELYLKLIEPNQKFYYFYESLYQIEMLRLMGKFEHLVEICEDKNSSIDDIEKEKNKILKTISSFYKDYCQALDEEMFIAMMTEYNENQNPNSIPGFVRHSIQAFVKNPTKFTKKVYAKSIFTNELKVSDFLSSFSRKQYKKIKNDFFFKMRETLLEDYRKNILPVQQSLNFKSDSLMRFYMQAQMDMKKNRIFYPDANFTLRVSYGKVQGAEPKDGIVYKAFTTLEGIIEKENPDIFDYVVEPKLKNLFQNKDYGQYADEDGSLHVGFIATNHTTGGNSGSPVLDADGNLIGINFDRQWEGTMSDLNFDSRLCRNITLDIRYCLFVIDKYAGAKWLVDEMNLIQ
jgi:hypothetical protein